VALPIFEPILQAVWAEGIAPKAPLNGPSPEAKRHLADLPIDYMSGSRINGGGQAFVEHFRLEADGKVNETQYQLVSHGDAEAARNPEPDAEQSWGAWGWGGGRGSGTSYYPGQGQQAPPQPVARGLFAPWSNWDDRRWDDRRGRFWGGRPN
jgi:hypothetical protein